MEEVISTSKELLFELNKEATRYYRSLLFSSEGKEGMEYLLSRGLTRKTIRKYKLGFASKDWTGLYNHLKAKGYSDSEMESASLISTTNGKTYDKFRNRVIFPIMDRMNNVIAFGGRTLDADNNAKYLNSSETEVFHKSNNVFSINFAKNTNKNYFILCEGYMDVISLNQSGFDNAVATLGTAITPQQAFLISRYTSDVVIAYDSDEPGQKAAEKAIRLLNGEGIRVTVLQMEEAKDPDEYIKKFGKEAFELLIINAMSVADFKFSKIQNSLQDLSGDIDNALKTCVDFMSGLSDEEREMFLSKLERRKSLVY